MRFPLLILLAGGVFAADLSPTEYIGYVKYLASEDMRGRATGSPELEKAAVPQVDDIVAAARRIVGGRG